MTGGLKYKGARAFGPIITIEFEEESFESLRAKFKALGIGGRFGRAMAKAINRTAVTARTKGSRQIRDKLGATIGAIKKDLLILKKASARKLSASLTARAKAPPLSALRPRQTRLGVTAAPWKKRRLYPHAFIAGMPTGHRGVYWREGRSRLPIKEIKVPTWHTVWQQVLDDGYINVIDRTLDKNIRSQIKYELSAGRRK